MVLSLQILAALVGSTSLSEKPGHLISLKPIPKRADFFPLFCPQKMKLHLHVGGNISKHSLFPQSAEFMVTDN